MIGISACLFTFRMRECKSGGGFVPTTHYKLIESQVRERRVSCSCNLSCAQIFSLSRRDVDLPRRDVKLTPLCHVATCIFTSRRQFVQVFVTSRHVLSRRDVNLHKPLSRRDVDFSRRDVIFYTSLLRRDVDLHVAT